MDLPLQIGVAVYHLAILAKLRMLDFYYNFIDKYINRKGFALKKMVRIAITLLFQKIAQIKIIKPEMREEYEKINIIFLPRESQGLRPTFKVDGKA